jgi:Uma2 family endonuclease
MKSPQEGKIYSYAEYATWDDDICRKCEFIDGVLYLIRSKTVKHQSIVTHLCYLFGVFLKGKKSPKAIYGFDVCLFGKGDKETNVFKPDLVVMHDEEKIEEYRYNGAPQFVIEILSECSASIDRCLKFNKYKEAGVREYWIVDPEIKKVFVHLLDNDYKSIAYDKTDTIPVVTLEGCEINLNEIFS